MNQFEENATDTMASGNEGFKGKTRQVTSKLKEGASQVKEKAVESVSRAKEQTTYYAEGKKSVVADTVEGYSSTIRNVADTLRSEQDPNIAQYVDGVAQKLEDISGYLRNRDFGGLMADAQDLARRRPEVVYAGMFVAGIAVARFFKAAQPPQPRSYESQVGASDVGTEMMSGGYMGDMPSSGPNGGMGGPAGSEMGSSSSSTPASAPENRDGLPSPQ